MIPSGAGDRRASRLGGPSLFHRLAVAGFMTLGTLSATPEARAEGPAPGVQVAPGFVYVPEETGESGCLPATAAQPLLLDVIEQTLAAVGADPDFVVILTSQVLSCASIFYLPIKNDVRGIGYGRSGGEELFDDAPDRGLQGIAFLNDLPYWLDNPEELEAAFLHELGHRFLARVHAEVDGEDIDLTGRQAEHWSYFLDSSGSPLEGNAWQDESTADSPQFPLRYSALDLYLMGAYEAGEVPPFRLLEPEDSDALDCAVRPVSKVSPPQICEPLTLAGTWLAITIDDVIAAEGPRMPSQADAPHEFSVAFLLLDPGGAGFGSEECEALSAATEDLVELFGEATDGRLSLENAAVGGGSCDEVEFALPPSSGCQVRPGRQRTSPTSLLLLCASLGALLWRRLNQRGAVA